MSLAWFICYSISIIYCHIHTSGCQPKKEK
ncbi:unnamed protein product [Spirodela intermedia]|uniref:Uncharacterized protein n=2 Tax=Spirodela intermedia TaxID=51605 RepID=A0A7I8K734_SPIIN|nr:unnamed protein product [Spirodela intermedia]CAA6656786.1 unnamed protein product [Spirodela intermedia]CAA7392709.1 unnamed protein product [Spirodela intermedia]